MRLKKLILVGSITALILLLCTTVLMDRKITEQQLESVIATDTATRTNIFVISQPEEEPLLPVSASYALSALVEEVVIAESTVEQHTTTRPILQESVPTDGFMLKIRNTKISVGYDTSEEALKKRPGWLNTSAYPGEEGVCIIYGHRNRKHLRVLEKAEIGDEINVVTENENTFAYSICDAYVVDDLSEIVITSTNEPTLVLVTCYPFRFSGSAPQKYIVTAVANADSYSKN